MAKISVIIPSYNHSKYIDEAVKSVLAQKGEVDLIVIDDGSTDNSVEKLKKYESLPHFKLVTQTNQGAHNTINRALNMVTGEFVSILNSDDFYHPDRFEKLLQHFEADPTLDFVVTSCQIVDSNSKCVGEKNLWHDSLPWGPQPSFEKLMAAQDEHLAFGLNLLFSNFTVTTSNFFFRKRILDDGFRMKPFRYAHDWDFVQRVWQSYQCKAINESLLSYRVHSSNTLKESLIRIDIEVVFLLNLFFAQNLSVAASQMPSLPIGKIYEYLYAMIERKGWQKFFILVGEHIKGGFLSVEDLHPKNEVYAKLFAELSKPSSLAPSRVGPEKRKLITRISGRVKRLLKS